MKKVLSLLTLAGVAAIFAAPAQADEFVARYTYLVNGAQLAAPAAVTTLSQPAVIDNSCGTRILSQPAVVDACGTTVLTQPAVVGKPIMVEDHENIVPHFFHLGLWPLVDFSIF